MAVASIQLIAPTSDITMRAEEIALTMGIQDQLECHVLIDFVKPLKLATKLAEQGVEIFIARRGPAELIRRALPTPLVNIPLTIEDVSQALIKARQLAGIKHPKVAFFGMPHQDEELTLFANLLNFELRLYHVAEQKELLQATLLTAIAEGADAVVAGSLAVSVALERGIPAVMLDSGPIALRRALSEAKSILYARALEKSQNKRFREVVDSSSNGILVLDKFGRLQIVNSMALKILGKRAIPLGSSVYSVLPDLDISPSYAGQTVRNAVVNSSQGTLILNMIPTFFGGQLQEIILSFVAAESIAELGATIHKTKNSQGFVSRYTFDDIAGISPQITETRKKAERYAAGDAPVLLAGETGTGKELFAHAIHQASPYSQGPFVIVNCASLPPTLLESELFGYEEGAFTGAARSGRPGFFELAHKGSIFLDEISELDCNGQVRLLRILQERTTIRIGGSRLIPLDIRIIAATNRNLWDMVAAGSFRKDLFFRLNVLPVFIPPLRDRDGDTEYLARHALFKLEGTNKPTLNRALLAQLKAYHWPGNVRELLNVMERYVMDSASMNLHEPAGMDSLNPQSQWNSMKDLNAPYDPEQQGINGGERARLASALEKNGWHQIRTAEQLGMDRTTLYRKMRIHGLRKP